MNISKISIISIIVLLLFASCMTVPVYKELGEVAIVSDQQLLEGTRGQLESQMRSESSGRYADVMVFKGMSDSVLGYNRTVALRLATLNAMSQIAEHMHNVIFTSIKLADMAKDISALSQEAYSTKNQLELEHAVNEALSSFSTSIASTQLSSLIVEKVVYEDAVAPSGVSYVRATVLCTVSDRIVAEIQKLITIAFLNTETISSESVELQRALINAAQKVTAEVILDEANTYFEKESDQLESLS